MHQSWKSNKQVKISHEEAINKKWKNHEWTRHKKLTSWKQDINKSWPTYEQVMNKSSAIYAEVMNKSRASLNPFCSGGGGQIDPHFFWAFITAKRPGQSGWNFLTFPVYLLTNDLTKKNWFFEGGTPPLAPQMGRPTKKWPPIITYDPIFLMQNLFILQKWGC